MTEHKERDKCKENKEEGGGGVGRYNKKEKQR